MLAISVVIPIYYAHLIARRAKNYQFWIDVQM